MVFRVFAFPLAIPCCALLEESFVGLSPENGSVELSQASILIDANDFSGVQITVDSLVSDLKAILGHAPYIVAHGSGKAAATAAARL